MISVPQHMSVESDVVARMSWDYTDSRTKLRELYEKGKASQWNADTDIDWTPELVFGAEPTRAGDGPAPISHDSPVPAELADHFRWEYQAWMTSQFLHGEQGALVATSRLVETVPDLDAKLYAASQVTDEARHVEAYARYLDKLGHAYPINPALEEMLRTILSESRWDMIYLGMQIIVEGLALAAFRWGGASFADPIIRQITELVARDEARHVAFGVVSLDGFYKELTSAELRDREEFICEAGLLMSRRFQLEEIWQRMGLDVAKGVRYATQNPSMVTFRQLMFSKIVSSLRRLGLLSPAVRQHFEEFALIRRPGSGRPAAAPYTSGLRAEGDV